MDLQSALEGYRPWNPQESADREEMLRRLRNGEALYTRDNPATRLTASAWIVSPDRSRALMAYHNLYGAWAWLGGHADGQRDLLDAAMREVREESGLAGLGPVSEEICSLEILAVNGHEKRGQYVPGHLRLNVTFLLEADPAEPLRCRPEENSQIRWFPLAEAVEASREAWFRESGVGLPKA